MQNNLNCGPVIGVIIVLGMIFAAFQNIAATLWIGGIALVVFLAFRFFGWIGGTLAIVACVAGLIYFYNIGALYWIE